MGAVLPNLFVIGAPKCGTTSLHTYLAAHPQIHMSAVKEPRFFAEPDPEAPFAEDRVGDRREYERLFETAAPVRGESSPSYSQYPRRLGVPRRIRDLVPEARFVYLVRDPIERTVSHYMQRVAYEGERRPLAEALGDPAEPLNPYVCPSRYATQIDQYLECFDSERLLVIDQVDLRDDRRATLRELFGFLGVDPEFESAEFDASVNVGYRRLPGAYARLRKTALARLIRRLPGGVYERLGSAARALVSRPEERPDLSPELRAELSSVFTDEVARLRQLTGKRFASWSL